MMNEFAIRLKMMREQKDISLSQLAEAVGSTKSALSRYENGKMEPGLKILIRLSKYFGVTLDWMAGNGNIDNVEHANKEAYANVINKSIDAGITPEKLETMVDIYKK